MNSSCYCSQVGKHFRQLVGVMRRCHVVVNGYNFSSSNGRYPPLETTKQIKPNWALKIANTSQRN